MAQHVPVMLTEVLAALKPCDGETYVDATFGGGGYSRAFLEAAPCHVIAFDRDPDAIKRAEPLQKEYKSRIRIIKAPFSEMDTRLHEIGIEKVHGIVFDLGVSSFHIDEPERGFSLRFDGPLDMRMDPCPQSLSAHTVVNQFKEEEIADILFQYGDERRSRRIAKAIVVARKEKPIDTTQQLGDLVRAVMTGWHYAEHPATRTFQALRIYVNDELGELEKALASSASLLEKGGRLVVVTFHSLEDRIVKQFIKPKKQASGRYQPAVAVETPSLFTNIYKKPLAPSFGEIQVNPRARSAKLRAAIYTGPMEEYPV